MGWLHERSTMDVGDIGLGCGRGTTQRASGKGAELRIAAALGLRLGGVFWKSLYEGQGMERRSRKFGKEWRCTVRRRLEGLQG